ncbi:hypothetical protein CVT24_012371 [Panaeolus cyanescens]|uniref:Uncharacterized protein n=1 Tax=Panaeolus cyanescens TaxID=181874 RepID=A0A409YYN1_9AGAR|nr:hypothetical protein CVT24_012371 [Panaeolus cyanescens]
MENTHLPSLEDDVFNSRDNRAKPAICRNIHNPLPQDTHPRPVHRRPESPLSLHSNIITPPLRRGSPLNPQKSNQLYDARRRPWPSESHNSVESAMRPRVNLPSGHNETSLGEITHTNPVNELEQEAGIFSNEYDLSHEDPRILQDVQRALKLKARREARLKRDGLTTPEKVAILASPTSQHSDSRPRKPSPLSFTPSPSPSARKGSNSTTSDVDFSPSVGLLESISNSHPVPTSIDNGDTLDWTGTTSEESDHRWAKALGKRRERDRLPPLGVIVDEQEQIFEKKLSSIRNRMSAQTRRKASIISDQLERRYNLLEGPPVYGTSPLNLVDAVRWYASQDELLRRSLLKAEPLTWLKHLQKRGGEVNHSQWCLSALMLEEYIQVQSQEPQSTATRTIPESSQLSPSGYRSRKSLSPSFFSISRERTGTTDERLSFEPLAESKRESLEVPSRNSIESGGSSVQTTSSAQGPLSPTSNLSSEFGIDVSQNLVESQMPASGNVSLSSDGESGSFTGPLSIPNVSIQAPSTENTPVIPVVPGAISQESSASSQSRVAIGSSDAPQKPKRRIRLSASFPDHPIQRRKRLQEEREERLRHEYESKAACVISWPLAYIDADFIFLFRLLHDAVSHNHRIRQFLNRISSAIKEYDHLQNHSAHVPGSNAIKLPKELVEAFGHDPAAVTGATRRLQDWRAVEDIHQRVHRQRAVFREFLDSFSGGDTAESCLLEKPMADILQALDELDVQRSSIVSQAENVASQLDAVQKAHASAKKELNEALAHVSVVYPELSTIVALEESYKDQYQQFWDLGMDALTLLLDTVTPFWRTYGKTIGEDVRDYLIIPLYRNEFTGEAKRYNITEFPRRSFKHWTGLVIFFGLSIAVNVLQVRAAIFSLSQFRLHLIPYDGIRWVALPFFWLAIVIQWLAVVFEFAIVLMELGAITWWAGWSIKVFS